MMQSKLSHNRHEMVDAIAINPTHDPMMDVIDLNKEMRDKNPYGELLF